MNDKKGITITNAFQTISDEFGWRGAYSEGRKPNKIWVDKGIEFYNATMKSWLTDNHIEIHSTQNKEKSVVAERFIRTLKKSIYKYMIEVSKNMYIDKLDDVVNK